MNVRRRSMIRDMLEQLMPFDEQMVGEELPSREGLSLVSFLRYWQEDQTFLEAFERLWSRLLSPEEAPEGVASAPPPVRVFTPEEEVFLTTEARGYLIKLHSAGLLNAAQLERVIDRAFECWTEEISLEQVRFLVSAVLLHEVFGDDESERGPFAPPARGN